MGFGTLLATFVLSLATMSFASVVLLSALERVGARFHISEGLFGLVAALGADSPEISSAISALFSGHAEVGVGIVLGSNIFNLAGLLGLSALITGKIKISRPALWFDGGVSLLVSLTVTVLILSWVSPVICLAVLGVILIPYVICSSLHRPQIARLNLPRILDDFLWQALGRAEGKSEEDVKLKSNLAVDLGKIAGVLALIIGSSVLAVKSATTLGSRLGINSGVLGILVLATLTSIPNVIAAIKLALRGRGTAVVSESLNSNTLNIIFGIGLPAVLLEAHGSSHRTIFAACWLFGMKGFALFVMNRRSGLSRWGGGALVTLYIVFAVIIIFWK